MNDSSHSLLDGKLTKLGNIWFSSLLKTNSGLMINKDLYIMGRE